MSQAPLSTDLHLAFPWLNFRVDSDGELEISVETPDGDYCRWLSRDEGQKLLGLIARWLA